MLHGFIDLFEEFMLLQLLSWLILKSDELPQGKENFMYYDRDHQTKEQEGTHWIGTGNGNLPERPYMLHYMTMFINEKQKGFACSFPAKGRSTCICIICPCNFSWNENTECLLTSLSGTTFISSGHVSVRMFFHHFIRSCM